MIYGLLEWSLKVVVASFFLLLLSLLLWFVFNAVMRVFHGPELELHRHRIFGISRGYRGWLLGI